VKASTGASGACTGTEVTTEELLREYLDLQTELRNKPRSEKVIESTVPDEPAFKEMRSVPSIFESYPKVEHEADTLKTAGKVVEAVAYLRALKAFIISGDVSKFPNQSLVVPKVGEVVDLTADDDDCAPEDAPQVFIWQVDCGDDGYIKFEDATSHQVEHAFQDKKETCLFTGFRGDRYLLNFEYMSQKNLSTGNFRPVRRVKLS